MGFQMVIFEYEESGGLVEKYSYSQIILLDFGHILL